MGRTAASKLVGCNMGAYDYPSREHLETTDGRHSIGTVGYTPLASTTLAPQFAKALLGRV